MIRSAPYADLRGQEALDAVLATSVFEQDISLLYMDDGVYQLLDQQQEGALLHRKQASATIGALRLYDVEQLFICAKSLKQRGLTLADLTGNFTTDSLLTYAAITDLINRQDKVLSF